MEHCLVLAGGTGRRLWPYSTDRLPKQLVPLVEGRSLLDLALDRARAVVHPDRVWLGVGPALRDAVRALPSVALDRVISEPTARDTLPAVALACATIAERDPDAIVAVLTADHLIEPTEALVDVLRRGFRLAAETDALVTFGVVPTAPETGFGYLELGEPLGDGARVRWFREKPDLDTAQRLLDGGALWNSGMFVWRAATLARAVHAFAPETAAAVAGTLAGDPDAWGQAPRRSVDHGVMEPASTSSSFVVAALPLAARWLDVGSWPAYGAVLPHDVAGNALAGRAVLDGARDCVVVSNDPEHVVAVAGCEGLVVVHTPEATLVVPVDQAQRVKALHEIIAATAPDRA